jgi:hypothetical protein
MTDFRNNPLATARGIRINNPMNLVKTTIQWQGKTKGTETKFETFATVEQGIRAGVIDIVGDICIDGYNTITKLIKSYAPPSENDTVAYINVISKATGLDKNAILNPGGKIDYNLLQKLVLGIIIHENGANAKIIPTSVIVDGINRATTSPNIKKYIIPQSNGITPVNGILNDLGPALFIGLFLLILLINYIK